MSKTFKIKVEDKRPEAEKMKEAWDVKGKNLKDSTIFHEFTVTEVSSKEEAIGEVLNLIDLDHMKILEVKEKVYSTEEDDYNG